MKKPKDKAKIIERLMRLTYSSLESHLRYTHIKTPEGVSFHKRCVKDYAETMYLISKLY